MAHTRRWVLAGAALSLALIPAACGSSSDTSASSGGQSTAAGADPCAKESLALTTAGTLTVATDNPAFPPWFVDDDPSNGKGYESAVAYAIAGKLGFDKAQVQWKVATFNSVIAPGKKAFDFAVNQFSISEERQKAVDFSSGYYEVRQTVVTYKGSPIDGKTTVADLAGATLGAQVGTTSYNAITTQIKPTNEPRVYDSNDLAVASLKNKQVDGIVVDLPTAFYMTAAQLDDGVIVGQLPSVGADAEEFGAVLSKGSPLTTCVTKAVDALRADGTLASLQTQWLSNSGAPELS